MGWETVILSLIANGVLTVGLNAFINRKKQKIEEKDADLDVEVKVKKLKDEDRVNAYEEKKKVQEMLDEWIDKYNELNKKTATIIAENTIRIEERQNEKQWRTDMERQFSELQRMYDISRCDKYDCPERKPPFNVCSK